MFAKTSLIIKWLLFSVLILLTILLIKFNQDVVLIDVKPFQLTTHQTVPLDRLLDLPIKFSFLIKPKKICDKTTKLIIFVHSKLDHFNARNEIRLTWGSFEKSLNYRLIFLIGLQTEENRTIEQMLKKEQNKYDDLVRGNFIDTYRNLTYKHVMGYKYILHYCATVNFILKSDDDAFLNIFEIIDLLSLNGTLNENNRLHHKLNSHKTYAEIKLLNLIKRSKKGKFKEIKEFKNEVIPIYMNNRSSFNYYKKLVNNLTKNNVQFIACSLFSNGTHTRTTGKWRLTKEEYDLNYLPAYCSGKISHLNTFHEKFG